MSLGNPSGLWYLAAVPLVVLLYWLRPRRLAVQVPSVLLWRRTLQEQVRQRPLRRFERNALLWVQLAAVVVASLALSRPQQPLPSGRDLVVVVDLGARLQATDVPPSRFEAARAAARDLVAKAPAGRFAVVGASRGPRVVQPPTPHRSQALQALAALQPTDGPSDLQAAVSVAKSLTSSGDVHVFTDQPVPGVRGHRFGGGLEDVAVTGVVASPVAQGRMRVTARVHNDTGTARQLEASVWVDGRLAQRLPLALAAGEEASVSAVVPAGLWVEVRLAPPDALPVTDRYPALGTRVPRPRVLVVGSPDPFLQRGLAAVAGSVESQRQPDPRTWPQFHVVVLYRVFPDPLPPGSYLVVDALPAALPAKAHGWVRSAVVSWQRHTHPLLRFVDLQGVQVARARALQPAGGEVLAEGEAPLLWAYQGTTVRAVVLPFAPQDSDLVTRPAFPILLANALDWLAGPLALQVEAGESVSVPAPGEEAVLHGPAGSVRVRARAGQLALPPFDRAGVYVLEAGPWRRVWAVHPSTRLPEPGRTAATSSPPPPAPREWGQWAVALFVALVVGEWYLFACQGRRR